MAVSAAQRSLLPATWRLAARIQRVSNGTGIISESCMGTTQGNVFVASKP